MQTGTPVLKTASCFAALRQLRTVRRCLPLTAYKSLIVSLVLSRLDYGNVTLSGAQTDAQMHKSQPNEQNRTASKQHKIAGM